MKSVSFPLPKPLICDNCASENISFVKRDVVAGRWPWFYHCSDCCSQVGCHPNTDIPLGVMGDQDKRALRYKAHTTFDRLWKNRVMVRSDAYAWLADRLGIPYADCHLSRLSNDQLKMTIEIADTEYKALEKIYARREKRRAKQFKKQLEREHKRNGSRLAVHKYS